MENPKVSIIIPIYNAGNYLHQCLDSILNQTLKEIEIICVDDGSADSSADILTDYARKDDRVTVIRQQNQHAGAARNNGMEKARGEYLLFLDADDFFEPTLAETTYHKAKAAGSADIVLFGARRYNDVTGKYLAAPHLLRRDLLPAKEVFSRVDLPDNFLLITTPCPWTKLFRRDFIFKEELKYQSLNNSNDVFFVYTALSLAETITYVDKDLVYYRVAQTENTQSSKDANPTLFLEALEAVYEKLQSREVYKDVEKSFIKAVVNNCVYNLDTLKTDESRMKVYEKLRSKAFICMDISNHLLNHYNSKANKLQADLRNTKKNLKKNISRENALKGSGSFRIGRTITWVPRKIRDGIHCYKQHGVAYTAKRIVWHVTHFK